MEIKKISLKESHNTYFYKLTDLISLDKPKDIKTYTVGNDTFLWSPDPFAIQIKGMKGKVEGYPFASDRISRIFDTLELKNNNINSSSTDINNNNIYYCEMITVCQDRRKLNYKKVFENKPNQLMPDNFYSFNPTGDEDFESPLSVLSFIDTEPFGLFTFSKMEDGTDHVQTFPSEIINWKIKEVMEKLTLPYLKSLPEYEHWISK